VLLLAQSFDPRWRARIDGTTRGPVSAFALDNGYVLRAGRHSGSIGFSGQNYGALGAGLSGAGLIVVVAVALCSRRRNRDWDA
jgi:hypothetical protein